MCYKSAFRGLFLLYVLVGSSTVQAAIKPAAIVDLGYGRYQASVNKTGKYYTFSNIRYAASPIGNLRFAAPTPPNVVDRSIKDSSGKIQCFQAYSGQDLAAKNGHEFTGDPKDLITPDPSETEDCLFLNLQVPSAVFDQRKKKAAVLVWIHGGGYMAGSKEYFDGAGLISRSQADGGAGIIFIAINYRLGMFGFLSGPTFGADGAANAGLLDQRAALEWVQKYIHLFGGDPNKVTVMGESAGGGSTMHQISAYGGLKGRVPFQQAIPQSPGFIPLISANQQETYYNTALSTASSISGFSITTLAQLRALPINALQIVSSLIIGFTAYGANPFSPVVDGSFAPAVQSHLFLHGQYDQSLKLLVGHNAREAFAFTPPIPNSSVYVDSIIGILLPQASKEVIITILNDLYPPVFDGSQGYTDQFGRLEKAIAEVFYDCNTRYLAKAFSASSFAYYVTIPPAYHGVDVKYTFFNGDTSILDQGFPVNASVARKFQSYLTNFVMHGDPNGKGLPDFPVYGAGAELLTIGWEDFGKVQIDNGANNRCDFWQKALWY